MSGGIGVELDPTNGISIGRPQYPAAESDHLLVRSVERVPAREVKIKVDLLRRAVRHSGRSNHSSRADPCDRGVVRVLAALILDRR